MKTEIHNQNQPPFPDDKEFHPTGPAMPDYTGRFKTVGPQPEPKPAKLITEILDKKKKEKKTEEGGDSNG